MIRALAVLSLILSGGAGTGLAGADSAAVAVRATDQEIEALSPSSAVRARATWYCRPGVSSCTRGWSASCFCAAISPDLRRWAGRSVRVSYRGRSVRVRIIDCNCRAFRGIDLYASAFRALAPLSAGRLGVILTN